jgi:hypothetical protein
MKDMKEQIEVKTRWQKRLERNDKDAKRVRGTKRIEKRKPQLKGLMVFHVSVSAISQRSCSHGAGRSMSRAAAFRKRLTWAPPFGSFSLSQSESDYFVILKYPDWVILSHNPDGNSDGNSDGKPSSFCENLVKLCQNGCDRSNKHMLICHFHFLNFTLHFHFLSFLVWRNIDPKSFAGHMQKRGIVLAPRYQDAQHMFKKHVNA